MISTIFRRLAHGKCLFAVMALGILAMPARSDVVVYNGTPGQAICTENATTGCLIDFQIDSNYTVRIGSDGEAPFVMFGRVASDGIEFNVYQGWSLVSGNWTPISPSVNPWPNQWVLSEGVSETTGVWRNLGGAAFQSSGSAVILESDGVGVSDIITWYNHSYPDRLTENTATLTFTSVPDGGMTLMLLSGVLVGIESLRRRFRA